MLNCVLQDLPKFNRFGSKKNLYRYKDGTGSRRQSIRGFSVLGDAGVSPCYIGLDC